MASALTQTHISITVMTWMLGVQLSEMFDAIIIHTPYHSPNTVPFSQSIPLPVRSDSIIIVSFNITVPKYEDLTQYNC